MNLKLYKLWRTDDIGYDETAGFIVAAESEKDARRVANEECTDEGRIWRKVNLVCCVEVGAAHEYINHGIVMADFRAG